jgi:hypothetical protein
MGWNSRQGHGVRCFANQRDHERRKVVRRHETHRRHLVKITRLHTVVPDNADGLGSITSLTNTAGALAETYVYSFGKQTSSSGSLTALVVPNVPKSEFAVAVEVAVNCSEVSR